jgi:hypothetical protein
MITLANIRRAIYNICKRLEILEGNSGGSSGGGFSGDYNDLSNKPSIPTVPSNETAVSGGSTLSLVTTGEKYTWNNKANVWRGTQA